VVFSLVFQETTASTLLILVTSSSMIVGLVVSFASVDGGGDDTEEGGGVLGEGVGGGVLGGGDGGGEAGGLGGEAGGEGGGATAPLTSCWDWVCKLVALSSIKAKPRTVRKIITPTRTLGGMLFSSMAKGRRDCQPRPNSLFDKVSYLDYFFLQN
jgi:hypothetical protein